MGKRLVVELAFGLLAGAAVLLGTRLGEYLANPYSEPRLSVQAWLDARGGGDTE